MLKRIGKLLSILAMMATAINAHCALACSLPVNEPAKDPHTCCNRHKIPLDQKSSPCPKGYVTVGEVYKTTALDLMSLPASGGRVTQLSVNVGLHARRSETHRAPDIPPFTNLRI